MLVAAIIPSAITKEKKTFFERRFIGTASQQANGTSRNQKPNKFTQVGVTVSPAPLKACSITMP